MEILSGIETIGTGLWLTDEKTLIICDVHLGYEQELICKGVLVPKVQRQQIEADLRLILSKIKPKRIVINGDLKHEFGRINRQEWKDVTALLTYLRAHCQELMILEGNHDPMLFPIADKLAVELQKELRLGDILITHGDKIPKQLAPVIIMGHEHPAITLQEDAKAERFKCFLKGKYKKSTLIVQPSFQPLIPGTDVLQARHLSPLIEDVDDFEVYIVNDQTLESLFFGMVEDLRVD